MGSDSRLGTSKITASRINVQNERFHGALEGVRELSLVGWLVDLDDPMTPVRLTIAVNGMLIAEVGTSLHRRDLAKIAKENRAGFRLELASLPPPRRIALGQALTRFIAQHPGREVTAIATIIAGPGTSMQMSRRLAPDDLEAALPVLLAPATEAEAGRYGDGLAIGHDLRHGVEAGSRYRGGIDEITGTQLRFWVVDLLAPNEPVALSLSVGGIELGETTTAHHRPDLASFFPDNRAGAAFDLASLPAPRLTQLLSALSGDRLGAPLAVSVRTRQSGASLARLRPGLTQHELLQRLRDVTKAAAPDTAPPPGRAEPTQPPRSGAVAPGLIAGARPIADLRNLKTGPRLRGGLDGMKQGQVTGWLVDLAAPGESVVLSVSLEGVLLRPAATTLHRADLAGFLPGNQCGFRIDLAGEDAAALSEIAEKLRDLDAQQLARPASLQIAAAAGETIPPGPTAPSRAEVRHTLQRLLPPASLLTDSSAAVASGGTAGSSGSGPASRPPPPPTQAALPNPARFKPPARLGAQTSAPESLLQVDAPAVLPGRSAGDEHPVLDSGLRSSLERAERRVNELRKIRLRLEQALQAETEARTELQIAHDALRRHLEALRAEMRRERARLGGLFATAMPPGFISDAKPLSVGHEATRVIARGMAREIANSSLARPAERTTAIVICDLFDPGFYRTNHPDGASIQVNPLLHYLRHGEKEGVAPHPLFDPRWYRRQVPKYRGNLLEHYVREGHRQGLRPHPLFDPVFYRAQLDESLGDEEPLRHFLAIGAVQGHAPSLLFDPAHVRQQLGGDDELENPLLTWLALPPEADVQPHPLAMPSHMASQMGISGGPGAYLAYLNDAAAHRDVAPHPLLVPARIRANPAFVEDPALSLLENVLRGFAAGDWQVHPLVDPFFYRYQLEQSGEVLPRGGALQHYCQTGYRRPELMPNPLFDPVVYRSELGETPALPDLLHYVLSGEGRGLRCHKLFSAAVYASQPGWRPELGSPLAHCLESRQTERLISDHRLKRPLEDFSLDLIRWVCMDRGDYERNFYRARNPDLSGLSDAELDAHFEANGRGEGRPASPRALLAAAHSNISCIPLGFFAEDYLAFNPDLPRGEAPLAALEHFVRHGQFENRIYGAWQFHLDEELLDPLPAEALASAVPTEARREVAVMIHIFYEDLLPELAGFARNFAGVPHDVFINVVDIAWNPGFQKQLRALCPGAFVQLSNDNGRDIGGFIRLADHIDFSRYETVAIMHSKKSPHIPEERATYWRRSMLHAFAGSPATAQRAVAAFRNDPEIGMLGAKEWRSSDMGKNYAQYRRLLERFGIAEGAEALDYLSGTMMMLRADVMAHLHAGLRQENWEYGGDKSLEFHVDGQIAHGVERLIPAISRHLGYRTEWV